MWRLERAAGHAVRKILLQPSTSKHASDFVPSLSTCRFLSSNALNSTIHSELLEKHLKNLTFSAIQRGDAKYQMGIAKSEEALLQPALEYIQNIFTNNMALAIQTFPSDSEAREKLIWLAIEASDWLHKLHEDHAGAAKLLQSVAEACPQLGVPVPPHVFASLSALQDLTGDNNSSLSSFFKFLGHAHADAATQLKDMIEWTLQFAALKETIHAQSENSIGMDEIRRTYQAAADIAASRPPSSMDFYATRSYREARLMECLYRLGMFEARRGSLENATQCLTQVVRSPIARSRIEKNVTPWITKRITDAVLFERYQKTCEAAERVANDLQKIETEEDMPLSEKSDILVSVVDHLFSDWKSKREVQLTPYPRYQYKAPPFFDQ